MGWTDSNSKTVTFVMERPGSLSGNKTIIINTSTPIGRG